MKKILEEYVKQGFRWIYKYPLDKLKDKTKPTRIFYTEPWFSIEGGTTWVDVYSCGQFAEIYKDKQAKFINLDIIDLEEPITIEKYIKKYCS